MRWRTIYLETAAWEMEMPSFASSPCTRGAPQRGLALLIFRISSRISGATPGRPGLRRRLFQVQYRLNPQRCQRTTVSGFTMTRTPSQSVQILRNSTQNPRSTFESRGRFTERREDGKLLPKSDILESQLATSLEGRDESANQRRNHAGMVLADRRVLPPLSVGKMTLRLYGALNYSHGLSKGPSFGTGREP